ncbi:kinase-like domain-containing protein [Aspergillus californicus]
MAVTATATPLTPVSAFMMSRRRQKEEGSGVELHGGAGQSTSLKKQPLFPTSRFSSSLNIASVVLCMGFSKRGIADIRSPSEPRAFPSSGWDNIDTCLPVEEESIPTYRPEKFYSVYIGEVFIHRYQVVGKLVYGSSATVRLCRDLLVTLTPISPLKIYTAATTIAREIEIYNHLRTIQSNHAGQSCLRLLIEIFQTQSPDRQSIHTYFIDLQSNNILLGKDDSILSVFEKAEFKAPVRRETLENRTIYLSRPLPMSYRKPVLCDLGEARMGTDQQQGDILPDIYRAPKVILNMTWDYKVDIWNVGMVIWDLFEHHHLFRARDPEGKLDDGYHLAEIQAVLGDPLAEFLARSERSLHFWDGMGKWKGPAPAPDYSLEALEERL